MENNVLMKASGILSVVWLIMFLLTRSTNIANIFCGKGIHLIGKEYYRFLTCGLIHTNLVHMLGNIYLILWLGEKYEGCIGSWKFLMIGCVGAICASIIMLTFIYPNATSSIGGSGAWYALVGFIVISQWNSPLFPRLGQQWMLIYLVIFNIPFLPGMGLSTLIFHGLAFAIGAILGVII